MTEKDPIAELQSEIEAEAAASQAQADEQAKVDAKSAKASADNEGDADASGEEAEVEASEEKDEDREPMLPKSRFDKVNVENRQLRKSLREREEEIASLKAGGAEPKTDEEKAKIKAEAKAEARLEVQIENFAAAGGSEYVEAAFNEALDLIADLGGNFGDVRIAIEATDSFSKAARAMFLLSQKPSAEIERFAKLSPFRKAAYLTELANSRVRKAKDDDGEEEAPPKRKGASSAPKPIDPVNGQRSTGNGLSDDSSEEEFDAAWFKDPRLGGTRAAN